MYTKGKSQEKIWDVLKLAHPLKFFLTLAKTATQLATRGLYIAPPAFPDNRGKVVFKKNFLEAENLFHWGRRHLRAGKEIQGNQIYFCSQARQKTCEFQRIPPSVVDAINEDVFKSYHLPVRKGKVPTGGNQAFQGMFSVYRHEKAAGFVIRSI